MDTIRSSRPGISQILAPWAPLPTNTASNPAANSERMLSIGESVAQLDAHVEDVVDLFVQHGGGQPERREC